MAKRLGVKFVACNTSLGFMGLEEDAFIPEVDSFAGAATFLGEARKGTVNLFI
jgi:peroxiredoxin family protein